MGILVNKKYLDAFLDDSEKALLSQFADNEKMKNAVRKVLLFGVYYSGLLKKGVDIDPTKNFALNMACIKGAKAEDIGADIKACWEGINEIECAFNRIDMYKTIEEIMAKKNQAR